MVDCFVILDSICCFIANVFVKRKVGRRDARRQSATNAILVKAVNQKLNLRPFLG